MVEDSAPEREIDVLRRGISQVKERMPPGWSAEASEEVHVDDRDADALITIRAPDGTRAVLVVEAKRLVSTRDVPAVLDQLRDYINRIPERPAVPLIVARYLAPSTRDRLAEAGASYADATGNVRVLLDRPGLFLRDVGANRDPWRGRGRPRGTLKGLSAALVVRALVDYAPPVTVPALVSRSGASTGATYRVVRFLEEEALIQRDQRGPIAAVEWSRLLERWSEDYGFLRSNVTASYLQPRGLPAVLDALKSATGLQYVLTGSLAAHHFAPYAPARLAMIYVDDLHDAAERLGLRQVQTGANVVLAVGNYKLAVERALSSDSLTIAAPSQAFVDLLSGPGRSAAEAKELLNWMQTHEPAWRR